MSNEKGPQFTPARESASRRQAPRHTTHSRTTRRATGAPVPSSSEGGASGGNRRRRPAVIAAAAATTVLALAALAFANRPAGDDGLAAKEEAQLIERLGLRDALERGVPVPANLVPASIQLRAGAVYRTEPPTSLERSHPDTFTNSTEEDLVLDRSQYVQPSNSDGVPMLMTFPEGSTSLTDAIYIPLTEENVSNMTFWVTDGVPLTEVNYGNFVSGVLHEGADMVNTVPLSVTSSNNDALAFSFTRDGATYNAMTHSHIEDVTATMANNGMRPIPVDVSTFPE